MISVIPPKGAGKRSATLSALRASHLLGLRATLYTPSEQTARKAREDLGEGWYVVGTTVRNWR